MELLKIFTVGGTIDKVYFDEKSAYEVGDPQVGQVLSRSDVEFAFEVETLFRKDSLELTDEDRARIRRAVVEDPNRRILITHGTDTMTATARALAGTPNKVIVLTGSMEPARFSTSHAIFNIGFAVAVTQAMAPGVYIAMNGRIFDGTRVRKNRERRRFEEVNAG